MEEFVAAISAAITVDSLWAQVTQFATFIGIVAVFVFGYRIARRVVTGAAKGKLKM